MAICVLDLAVLDDAALLEVDQEQLARLQPAEAHDSLGGHVEQAGLRAEHDMAVLGHAPSGRGAGRCGRAWRRRHARR